MWTRTSLTSIGGTFIPNHFVPVVFRKKITSKRPLNKSAKNYSAKKQCGIDSFAVKVSKKRNSKGKLLKKIYHSHFFQTIKHLHILEIRIQRYLFSRTISIFSRFGSRNLYCRSDWFEKNDWLVFSVISDSLYCLSCLIFPSAVKKQSALTLKSGLQNWSSAKLKISNHKGTDVHNLLSGKLDGCLRSEQKGSYQLLMSL